jgi:hypothetical protein
MTKWIYLLKTESDLGDIFYKIGITQKDPLERVKELQTGNPHEIELIQMFKSKYAFKVESSLHRRYNLTHKRGEWFSMDDEEIETFLIECVNTEKAFDVIEKSKIIF